VIIGIASVVTRTPDRTNPVHYVIPPQVIPDPPGPPPNHPAHGYPPFQDFLTHSHPFWFQDFWWNDGVPTEEELDAALNTVNFGPNANPPPGPGGNPDGHPHPGNHQTR
jgi:hypothetical protein